MTTVEARRLLRMANEVRSTQGAVASPCVSVCRMNTASGLCDGCFRSLDEIACWSRIDDRAKRTVWAQIETRIEEALA